MDNRRCRKIIFRMDKIRRDKFARLFSISISRKDGGSEGQVFRIPIFFGVGQVHKRTSFSMTNVRVVLDVVLVTCVYLCFLCSTDATISSIPPEGQVLYCIVQLVYIIYGMQAGISRLQLSQYTEAALPTMSVIT